MTVKGLPKIDGVALGEFTAVFLGEKSLKAKAAFVNTRTGETHGWTMCAHGWSPATLTKLQELRELLEADVAKVHMESDSITGAVVEAKPGLRLDDKGNGIGEFLEAVDVPSV